MPANQPSNAPEDLQPRPEPTGAAVLADEQLDDPPGGGGLGGKAAADDAPDRAQRGVTPSNPASPAVAGDTASVRADDEAREA